MERDVTPRRYRRYRIAPILPIVYTAMKPEAISCIILVRSEGLYQRWHLDTDQNVNIDTMLTSDKSLCLQAFSLCQGKKPPFRRGSGRRILHLFVFGVHPMPLRAMPFVYRVRFRVRSTGERVHEFRYRVKGTPAQFAPPSAGSRRKTAGLNFYFRKKM